MFYVLSAVVVVADQLAKWIVVHRLDNGPLLGDLLRLTLTENTGAAFGLFPGARASFVAISVVAAGGLVWAHHVLRPGDRRRPYLALILGGNLGNLVDRLRLGRVVDFLDMGLGTARWPVYNLADVAVVAGAVGLALLLLVDALAARRAAPEERSADTR